MASHSGSVSLSISLGHLGDDSLQLRFPPEYREEIFALLDEHSIDHNTALEFSSDPSDWIEVVHVLAVGFSSVGGLAGLAAVITAVARRYDGKRIVFKRDGDEVEITGYSQKAVEAMLREMPAKQIEHDAEVRRRMGLPPGE